MRVSICTLQHTATHCNTLQQTATRCNTLHHTATHCNTLQHASTHCNTLQLTATHCNTLQHTAPHLTTLQVMKDVDIQKLINTKFAAMISRAKILESTVCNVCVMKLCVLSRPKRDLKETYTQSNERYMTSKDTHLATYQIKRRTVCVF